MERGSDKHNPRVDDQMAHETEGMVRAGRSTHAQEWKDPEPSGEDQPDVDRDPAGTLQGATPAGMTADDVEGRTELARYLGRHAFPSPGAQLALAAQEQGAPDAIVARLQGLASDRIYENLQEAWLALGGHVEDGRS